MKKSYRGWGFYISLIVVVVLVWFLLDGQHLNQDDYNYAQFKQELADDEIKSVEVQPNRVYPTGRLDIVKTDKSEETLYVLDVSEAQSLMDKEKFTSYVVNDSCRKLADEFIAALTCVWSNVYSVYDCYEQSGSRRWWWQQDDEFWKKPGKDDHR